jgi:nucleoid DNA-binding protein
MTRKDITKSVSTALDINVGQAEPVIRCILDVVLEAIATEGRLELRNFGIFEVRRRNARRARNPRTGERVDVPEKHFVTFTPGRVMKQRTEGGPRRHTQAANPPAVAPRD